MGYAQTKIAFYGIKLNDEIAQEIYDYFMENEEYQEFTIPGLRYYRKIKKVKGKNIEQETPVSPYSAHEKTEYSSLAMYPTMISDGADGRAQDLNYGGDDNLDTYIGVFMAENGYGSEDKVEGFIKSVPEEVKKIYDEVIKPILKEASFSHPFYLPSTITLILQ